MKLFEVLVLRVFLRLVHFNLKSIQDDGEAFCFYVKNFDLTLMSTKDCGACRTRFESMVFSG